MKKVDALLYVEHFRLLSTEFEIRTNSRALIKRLSALSLRAEQDLPIVQRCTVTITWIDDEFRIRGDGFDDFELSVTGTLETLLQGMQRRALVPLADHIALRAVTGQHQERSFLIVGSRNSGKSTLALRLLLGGLEVSGDETALLCHGSAVAFPRRFLLRGESLALMPKASHLEGFAGMRDPRALRLAAVDPLDVGRPWRISPAPVSTVVCLEPNYGLRTRLVRCGKVDMIRRVIPQCRPPISARKDWVSDVAATVNQAGTFVIELGDLDSALAEIKEVLLR